MRASPTIGRLRFQTRRLPIEIRFFIAVRRLLRYLRRFIMATRSLYSHGSALEEDHLL